MDSRTSASALKSSAVAAAVLAAAAIVAVAVLALVHERAAPQIEASRRAQHLQQLTALLGGAAYDNDPLADTVGMLDPELLGTDQPLVAHRVRLGATPVAVLLNVVAPDGYSGAMRLLVAIDPQGRLLGVRVLEHHETPGLGDLVEERRSDWIRGFDGRALGDPPIDRWTVRRDGGDFDQFTGATVTPRAVVQAVRNALVYFSRHRDELLAAPAPVPAP